MARQDSKEALVGRPGRLSGKSHAKAGIVVLNWARSVQAFVESHRVARLATVDAEGRPLVLPICYVLAGDNLYSPIDAKPKRVPVQRLKRLRNLQANPRVALVIDDYREDWTQLAYVILHGTAEILTQGPEFDDAVGELREKYPQYRSMPIQDNPLIAVRLMRVVSWGAVDGVSRDG
ncbi:MAG: TIGR03668 family PPOX class F420-dependent oxidoreductase [Nitrospinae bacterium]|nr:TIGR03668 family PPOX class F420-dependent oxidoreductase [Nitrospinota bacterium]